MITVIIPYYQNKSGILAKALNSIENQIKTIPIHVLVIDDASPISAESELNSINHKNYTIEIIHQPNGGPASARNKGIENSPKETLYIAFLDSDDEWSSDHLSRAVESLQAGHEFYFSDHYQLNSKVGAFSRAGRITPANHPKLATASYGLHAYQGDLLDQIIRGNVIGTSTVVYDFLRFKNNRFKTEFTNAGEDYLFWMEIAHSNPKVAFSNQCEATYGSGVNIYAGSGWGSEKNLLRIHNEIKYRKLTKKLFPTSTLQNQHIKENINILRKSFSQDLIHRLFHGKSISLRLIKNHLFLDPITFTTIPKTIINIILKK